jgi:hypothetical protein
VVEAARQVKIRVRAKGTDRKGRRGRGMPSVGFAPGADGRIHSGDLTGQLRLEVRLPDETDVDKAYGPCIAALADVFTGQHGGSR